ncbi:ATP-binding cassette domain-containing protein [Stutzerimonas stutzeri]|uniref:ATP-binding cassette domain-containing protein n=1 Tax=Stutzerimonas stutzeri TaxID=316 RepID=UPI0015E2FB2B|nr:ATP-binding cassette domain-containing protein [Stutzerimonas stutzeri]MBA1264672.1 ABC transporter ATP-binding protein [Stutzerimonas stutzeri]
MLELSLDGSTAGHSVIGRVAATVAEGDRICLLGPSGAGKTTLLNAIAGLDPRLSPMIHAQVGLRIGYLFQEHRLLPWRTLRQNLALVGAAPDEIERLLGEVGLAGAADRLPDQLSLGMARRAALARCLAIKPQLLLLDEPFASLDPDRASELRSLIARLLDAQPRMAMICVTHDARDADDLANRLWYLAGAPAQLQCDQPLGGDASASVISERLRLAIHESAHTKKQPDSPSAP